MFYVIEETGEIVTLDYIRNQHPRVSFTTNGPDDDFLKKNGFGELATDVVPDYEPGQALQSMDHAEKIDGKWLRVFNVTGEPDPVDPVPNEAVVKSPNGTAFRVTVDDNGNSQTEAI